MKNTVQHNVATFFAKGKTFILAAILIAGSGTAAVHAQVGVGTTSPNANAALDVTSTSTNKGFLPPRVALTSRSSASPLSAFVSGMIVYNTATAGTTPNKVTPGLYYSNGTRWVRLIISKGDQTVDVDGLASGLASPSAFPGGTYTPNTPGSTDKIYVNTADGTTWTYNGSTYDSYEEDPSTPFYLANGTIDAGTNKASKIYRTGNIGIGNTNPAVKLDIIENLAPVTSADYSLSISATNNNRVAAIRMVTGANATIFGQNGNNADGGLLANAAYWGAPAGGHDFQVITNNMAISGSVPTAALTIKNLTNYVGFGTATPHAPIQLSNNSSINKQIVIWENPANNDDHQFYGLGVNASTLRYQVGNPGASHVFYASTSATTSDELCRISNAGLWPGQDNLYPLGNATKRWASVWAVNGLIQTSDKNLKTNIKDINYGLKDIMKLRPVTYNWKATPDKDRMVGLIAQEVEQVIPEAVIAPKEKGDYYGMKYNELVPVLIKGVQEQQGQITTQQEQIAALQQQLADKDQRIASLESKEAAYAQLAVQVKEMRQMLGMKKKAATASVAKK